jgi:hypothetical protein
MISILTVNLFSFADYTKLKSIGRHLVQLAVAVKERNIKAFFSLRLGSTGLILKH